MSGTALARELHDVRATRLALADAKERLAHCQRQQWAAIANAYEGGASWYELEAAMGLANGSGGSTIRRALDKHGVVRDRPRGPAGKECPS